MPAKDPYEHDPHLNPAAAEHAKQVALANGHDPLSFWEHPVIWVSHVLKLLISYELSDLGRVTWTPSGKYLLSMESMEEYG